MNKARFLVCVRFFGKHWWRFAIGVSLVVLIVWSVTHFGVVFTKITSLFVKNSGVENVSQSDTNSLPDSVDTDNSSESALPVENVVPVVLPDTPPVFYIVSNDGIYTANGFLRVGMEKDGFVLAKISRRFGFVVFIRSEDQKNFYVSFGNFAVDSSNGLSKTMRNP